MKQSIMLCQIMMWSLMKQVRPQYLGVDLLAPGTEESRLHSLQDDRNEC